MWTALFQIISNNLLRIGVTYSLMLLEFIIYAITPYLIGVAIDSLLYANGTGFLIFIISSITACLIGTIRRMVDTRTFSVIWVRRATNSILTMIKSGVSSSSVISRGHLQTTYGDFLEYTMPTIISAFIDVVAAIIILWMIIPVITCYVSFCVIALCLVQVLLSRKLMTLDRQKQSVVEESDAAIMGRDGKRIVTAYDKIPHLLIRRSDLEAFGWALTDIMSVSFSAVAIYYLTTNNHSVGDVISTVTYCRQVFFKTNFISFLLTHLRQMKLSEELCDVSTYDPSQA